MSKTDKTITVLGATGSVGQSTLALIREHAEHFHVHGLSANTNWQELASLAHEFHPAVIAIADEGCYQQLKQAVRDCSCEVLCGEQGVETLASAPVDLVVGAIVGMAGLGPVRAAVDAGQTVALANKEALVAAGHLIMPLAKQTGSTILPIDSEHNAVFQCLRHEKRDDIQHIILTASGGPFRTLTPAEMKTVTVRQALAHPNWSMGPKVTIDSATMMNKGLELIEAYWLFDAGLERLDALIHPQSVVHGMVGFCDGSWLAHLGIPDMRVPISYALGWPARMGWQAKPLSLTELQHLDFEAVDEARFACFALAKSVLGSAPEAAVILNTANEIAVQKFLNEDISFTGIAGLVEDALSAGSFGITADNFAAVSALDKEIRQR